MIIIFICKTIILKTFILCFTDENIETKSLLTKVTQLTNARVGIKAHIIQIAKPELP